MRTWEASLDAMIVYRWKIIPSLTTSISVHILFRLGRTVTVSDAVANVKKGASDWLRARSREFAGFYWQGGYGAFSVSQSGVEEVRIYIRNQQEHHRRRTFQEEFLEFLHRYEVDYDERYLWD